MCVAAWSAKEGVEVLREGLQRLAGWRLKAMGGWRRPRTLVIDIDSLPVEVHGEQLGSAWNGYYHRRVYHPIVASAGETGDILDLRLREGQVHTADGGLEFVLEVLERAERHLCGNAVVRFDAGYPGEPLMAALEERGTHYVARVRDNAVLKRLALPAIDAVVWDALNNGAPVGGEPRTWVRESSYRAGSWSRPRRVVQVVVERPGELIPRCFWLLTSMTPKEMSGEDLLALYRKRGKAEGHLGELMSVVAPALSSTSRRKSHYRGRKIGKREGGGPLRLQPGPPAAGGLRLPDHACPARRAGTHDRHRLEPAAPRRTRAPHPGALHRLGPLRHDEHRRRVGALAHARPRTRDPARALRIAGPPPSADPFPGPGGREDAKVSPGAENYPFRIRRAAVPPPEPPRITLAPALEGCARSPSPSPYPRHVSS